MCKKIKLFNFIVLWGVGECFCGKFFIEGEIDEDMVCCMYFLDLYFNYMLNGIIFFVFNYMN